MEEDEYKSFGPEEIQSMYGNRKVEVDSCFARDDHYYKQRENDVIHIGDELINTLHEGFFNKNREAFEPVPEELFDIKFKELIYRMDIQQYWKL